MNIINQHGNLPFLSKLPVVIVHRVLDNEAIDIEARHTQACVVVNWSSEEPSKKFFRFSTNTEQTESWIAAVNWKNWSPTEYSMSVVIILLLVRKPVVYHWYKTVGLVFCPLDTRVLVMIVLKARSSINYILNWLAGS